MDIFYCRNHEAIFHTISATLCQWYTQNIPEHTWLVYCWSYIVMIIINNNDNFYFYNNHSNTYVHYIYICMYPHYIPYVYIYHIIIHTQYIPMISPWSPHSTSPGSSCLPCFVAGAGAVGTPMAWGSRNDTWKPCVTRQSAAMGDKKLP